MVRVGDPQRELGPRYHVARHRSVISLRLRDFTHAYGRFIHINVIFVSCIQFRTHKSSFHLVHHYHDNRPEFVHCWT